MANADIVVTTFMQEIGRLNLLLTDEGAADFEDQRMLNACLTRLIAFAEILPPADMIEPEDASPMDDAPAPVSREGLAARFSGLEPHPGVNAFPDEGVDPVIEMRDPVDAMIRLHADLNRVRMLFEKGFSNASLRVVAETFPGWGRAALDLKSYFHAYFYDA